MVALSWEKSNNPRFEAGVDHGVVYPENAPGVVWDGLVAVEEGSDGGELEAIRFDGIKTGAISSARSFSAVIRAFAIPRALEPCVGLVEAAPGIFLTRQPPKPFGFSYRVQTSENTSQIHLVYNGTATQTERGYATLSKEVTPTTLAFQLNAIVEEEPGVMPTAHFVIDPSVIPSRAFLVIEKLLYGTTLVDPQLPDISTIVDLIRLNDFRMVVPNTVSGLADLPSAQNPIQDMYVTRIPGVFARLPESRLSQSPGDPAGLNRLE